MTLAEAKQLKTALDNAIAAAEAAGIDHVDLAAQAAALDDQARAELDAAINEAQSFGGI
jgi:2-hydroxychromene-2-carboxylate isomerase